MTNFEDIDILIEEFQNATVEKNENYECCSKCGGTCCKTQGCEIFPQDVKRWYGVEEITEEILIDLICSGFICLDWWEGDLIEDEVFEDISNETYHDWDPIGHWFFLRMRSMNDSHIFPAWIAGTCVLLSPTGCRLSWEARPLGGKALVPKDTKQSCTSKYSKKESCMAWFPYWNMLERIWDKLGGDHMGWHVSSDPKMYYPLVSNMTDEEFIKMVESGSKESSS